MAFNLAKDITIWNGEEEYRNGIACAKERHFPGQHSY